MHYAEKDKKYQEERQNKQNPFKNAEWFRINLNNSQVMKTRLKNGKAEDAGEFFQKVFDHFEAQKDVMHPEAKKAIGHMAKAFVERFLNEPGWDPESTMPASSKSAVVEEEQKASNLEPDEDQDSPTKGSRPELPAISLAATDPNSKEVKFDTPSLDLNPSTTERKTKPAVEKQSASPLRMTLGQAKPKALKSQDQVVVLRADEPEKIENLDAASTRFRQEAIRHIDVFLKNYMAQKQSLGAWIKGTEAHAQTEGQMLDEQKSLFMEFNLEELKGDLGDQIKSCLKMPQNEMAKNKKDFEALARALKDKVDKTEKVLPQALDKLKAFLHLETMQKIVVSIHQE